MKRIHLSPQSGEEIGALDRLYRTSKDGRLRQRAQIILLTVEQGLVAAKTGAIVRLNEESVHKWLKRYEAEGIAGLKDEPRPGIAPTVTDDYQAKLIATVRRRPLGWGAIFHAALGGDYTPLRCNNRKLVSMFSPLAQRTSFFIPLAAFAHDCHLQQFTMLHSGVGPGRLNNGSICCHISSTIICIHKQNHRNCLLLLCLSIG